MQYQNFVIQILMLNHLVNTEHMKEVNNKQTQTKGEPWPTPKSQKKQDLFYTISPKLKFEFIALSLESDLLRKVIKRFLEQLNILNTYANESPSATEHPNYGGEIKVMEIAIKTCCDELPHFYMLEHYKLKIELKPKITSINIWGVIRAFDTLLQLCYINEDGMFVVNQNLIDDYPKYPHRGLMIDTESHYISVDNIIKMIDAMAMNKMNVLHWRIVGDNSFPYKSNVFPELSEYGAFSRTMVYDESAIREIIDFATLRGIRVIPEFNMPGHLRSIGKSYPEFLTTCSPNGPPTGPLNLAEPTFFDFFTNLLREVQERFPDDHIHIGGDDFNEQCWDSNPDIQSYIEDNLVYFNLHLYLVKKLLNILKPNTQPIIAQNVLNHGMIELAIPEGIIVQAYDLNMYAKAKNCLKHSLLVSWPWNLSNPHNMSLAHMYENSAIIDQIPNCIGGEAILNSATVDDTNIFHRVWPRACVAADVLWNGNNKKTNFRQRSTKMGRILKRIREQVNRMARLQIPVLPLGAGFN